MPFRRADHKWVITREEFAGNLYPPYAHGPGYILSAPLVRRVVAKYADKKVRASSMSLIFLSNFAHIQHLSFARVMHVPIADSCISIRRRWYGHVGKSH